MSLRTQSDRRASSGAALLESAARGMSRYGYGNLVLEKVAREAGYSRGALYHQFRDKQELALAVVAWVLDTWRTEVLPLVEAETDPAAALMALARGHAVYCRRDVARVMIALRVEFAGQEHPVGTAVEEGYAHLLSLCLSLIEQGRHEGTIAVSDPGPALALAYVGALEGAVIALAGQAPHDEHLAARAAAGVLGLVPSLSTSFDRREAMR